jgi:hypothetical protein
MKFLASDNFSSASNGILSNMSFESFSVNEKECKNDDFGIFGSKKGALVSKKR